MAASIATTSRKGASGLAVRPEEQRFLVLAANTAWVYALAEGLAEQTPVHCVRFYDWSNYRRLRPRWPLKSQAQLDRTMWVMPPGYAGSLEFAARPFMRKLIRSWYDAAEPYVICPFPYLAPWLRKIPSERLIYYNLDEYTLYNPSRSKRIRAQEDELVERASVVLCLAQYQVDVLRARHCGIAEKIVHFPLGVEPSYLLPDTSVAPVPNTVGYVGNLGDRVDWAFVADIVANCANAHFIFVGPIEEDPGQLPWQKLRADVLSRPNVRHLGEVAQTDVCHYYWSFAVNWMPYDTLHPFNLASCPTKIMDGLASGRPFISTAVPEALLYPGLIHIARSPDEAKRIIDTNLLGNARHDTRKQLEFASGQTWSHRASELRRLLKDRAEMDHVISR